MTPSEVESLIQRMEETGNLPRSIPASTVKEVSKSLSRYFTQVGKDKIQEFTDKARALLNDALNTEQLTRLPKDEAERAAAMRGEPGLTREATVGESRGSARGKLLDFLEEHTGANIAKSMDLDFFLRIPMEVASGAAQKLAQNFDAERVDEFPGLEFHRVYDRDIPRGSEKDPAGPENSWDPDRWEAACDESGDEEAAAAFESSGRMVALKSSGVWAALGAGAGGYDDCLGNDFPPFAWNSGMDVDELSYDDCVSLGLLDQGEDVEKPDLDMADLIPGMEAHNWLRTHQALQGATLAQGRRTNAPGAVLASPRGGLQAGFEEEEHPRDKDGKFAPAEGGVSFKQGKVSKAHGDVVVQADVEKADKTFAETDQYVGKEGAGGIGKRYQQFGEFLKKGEPVETPEVYLDHGKMRFNNGRHRWAYLRDSGHKTLPVSVLQEHAEEFKEKFGA